MPYVINWMTGKATTDYETNLVILSALFLSELAFCTTILSEHR